MAELTLSVVSHRQNALVNQLLGDLRRVCAEPPALIVTENVLDSPPIALDPSIVHIVNDTQKGFGANHNEAFKRCKTEYFCVCNPDIRLSADPFPSLLSVVSDRAVGAVGPLVRNPEGKIEDSARRFPTVWSLIAKSFIDLRAPDYPTDRGPQQVDWVAGMFMLFRREAFESVKGFDEGYFLYYEDVDICRRIRKTGSRVIFDPRSEVVHDAQRASRRDPRRAAHHLRSALRFLSAS